MLTSAQKDLARFRTLVAKSVETQQALEQQQAKVDQLIASIEADSANIETAQTQLDYTRSTQCSWRFFGLSTAWGVSMLPAQHYRRRERSGPVLLGVALFKGQVERKMRGRCLDMAAVPKGRHGLERAASC